MSYNAISILYSKAYHQAFGLLSSKPTVESCLRLPDATPGEEPTTTTLTSGARFTVVPRQYTNSAHGYKSGRVGGDLKVEVGP